MFEGVVASLFNRYLGKYVEDLDLENLNVGIFSGNVVLENLKLKPEALVSCKMLSQAVEWCKKLNLIWNLVLVRIRLTYSRESRNNWKIIFEYTLESFMQSDFGDYYRGKKLY